MALVRTKLRRRVVAVAFVLATMIGLGAVGAKPAHADTALCGWVVPTQFSQGGFIARPIDVPEGVQVPLYLHVFVGGQWTELSWNQVMFASYLGVYLFAWGAVFYIPGTDCWNYVS